MAGIEQRTFWDFAKMVLGKGGGVRTMASNQATFLRTDTDGTQWVRLAGSSDETPVNGRTLASAQAGDTVEWSIDDGVLSITGNATEPSVGERKVTEVVRGAVGGLHESVREALDASEASERLAEAAQAVASAINQHFWTDTSGIHVTEATQEAWQAAQTGANVLINSVGQLFRDGLNNLLAILPSGIAIYDGNGNDEANVVASFTRNLITLGQNTREAAIEMCGGAYEVSSSVHEISGSRVTHLTARESFEDPPDEWSETVSDIETSADTATSRLGIRCEHHDGGYKDGEKTHSHDTYASIDAIADARSSTIYLEADTIGLRGSKAGVVATVVYDDPYTADGVTPNRLQLGNPTRYQNSGSYSITTAGIDTYTNGPRITIPAGSYMFVGTWTFNSASASGDRNMQVGFRSGPSGTLWGERVRIRQSSGNFAVLNVSALRVFTSQTTVYLAGSASITSGAGDAWITAVRLN